jgi:hypothetical protein
MSGKRLLQVDKEETDAPNAQKKSVKRKTLKYKNLIIKAISCDKQIIRDGSFVLFSKW